MARKREELWPVIAVSVSRLADALGIERREIYEAIKDDLLPAYRHGTHVRILIADAIEWVRNTWKRERVR
jgi:excisionase family DNA binding protein